MLVVVFLFSFKDYARDADGWARNYLNRKSNLHNMDFKPYEYSVY